MERKKTKGVEKDSNKKFIVLLIIALMGFGIYGITKIEFSMPEISFDMNNDWIISSEPSSNVSSGTDVVSTISSLMWVVVPLALLSLFVSFVSYFFKNMGGLGGEGI